MYSEQVRFTVKPPLGKIRGRIATFQPRRTAPQAEPVLHYTIECTEHKVMKGQKTDYYIGREDELPDEDTGKRWAEGKRQAMVNRFGGEWITIWYSKGANQ